MVRLELLYATRSHDELSARRSQLAALADTPIAEPQWRRALDVYERLAASGGLHHRAVKHPDLLIAAAAESADLEVLHYDEDYERIAAITGQSVRWLVPRGSIG